MAVGDATRDGRELRAVPAQGTAASVTPAPTVPPQTSSSGELPTRSVVDALAGDTRVLHSRQWPERGYEALDHVVVAPTGIFVIDSVGWTGEVAMTPDVLEVNERRRVVVVQAVHETARDVALLLSPDLRDHVVPVLCLGRDEPISGWVKAVRVCSTSTLRDLIEDREAVLTGAQVTQIADELDAALPSTSSTASVRTRAADHAAPQPDDGDTAAAPDAPWYRSLVGRIVAGVVATIVASGLVFVGVEVTKDHPSSKPGHPHRTVVQQR